jgi:hypothetical protein
MAKEKSEQDGLVKKLNDEVSKGQKNAAGFWKEVTGWWC